MISTESKKDYMLSAKSASPENYEPEDENASITEQYWSSLEEKRLVLKIDLSILLFLMFSFFSLQLDRSNISNALTGGIGKDIHCTTDEIATGNQLQSAAIVIMEIPSNIIIHKVGCLPLLIAQGVLWGLVAIFQSFITGKKSYYATRWLLGMFEAGFIPGSIYVISRFYKRNELATRTTLFYFGNYFAAAVGSLIAAGILGMPFHKNWHPWRFLFMIEGCITIFATLLLAIFVARSPENPSPVHNLFSFFSKREERIMQDRLKYYDSKPSDNSDVTPITLKNIFKSIFLWRNWLHLMMNFLQIAPYGGLQLFSPKIIKSLGFSTVRANALASIGPFGLCFFSLTAAWLSDRYKTRGLLMLLTLAYSITFAGVLQSMRIGVTKKWTMFAMITMINAGVGTAQSLNNSWLAINSRRTLDRSVGLAMCVMGANLAAIAGQNFFKDKDAPVYHPAFVAILCFYGVSILWCSGIMFIYYSINNRLKFEFGRFGRFFRGSLRVDDESHSSEIHVDEVSTAPEWKYQF